MKRSKLQITFLGVLWVTGLFLLSLSAVEAGGWMPGPLSEQDQADLIQALDDLALDNLAEPAETEATQILANPAYSQDGFLEFFEMYFSDRPLTDELRQFLNYRVFSAPYASINAKLQKALHPVMKQKFEEMINSEMPLLHNSMEADSEIRQTMLNSIGLLARITVEGEGILDFQKTNVYYTLLNILQQYPAAFSRSVTLDSENDYWVAIVRAQLIKLMWDTEAVSATQFISDTGFPSSYHPFIHSWGLLILDNNGLTGAHLQRLQNMLFVIPDSLHNTSHISVNSLLGNKDPTTNQTRYYFKGRPGVNIFNAALSQMQNQFPTEVIPGNQFPAYSVPIFCSTAQHEVNHIVDSFVIRNDEKLDDRKSALLDQAGTEQLQYLRSQVGGNDPGTFFNQHPQEFFASLSNEYLANSYHTLDLALERFDVGYKEPLNQLLYISNIYSLGTNQTRFYVQDQQCSYSFDFVNVLRNHNEDIVAIDFGAVDDRLNFLLDSTGNVMDYASCPADSCGNGVCDINSANCSYESYYSCSADCEGICGDAACDPTETYLECPGDCPISLFMKPITTEPFSDVAPDIDGTRIVWQTWQNGNYDVYFYDLDTPEIGVQQIAGGPSNQSNPRIDGSRIVWQDYRNGNYDIYLYDLNAPELGEQQITTHSSHQTTPAIDGSRIVWRDQRGNYDIYLYDLNAPELGEQQITTNAYGQHKPDIDGTRIVWQDGRNGPYDIYLYDLNTPELGEQQITTDPTYQSSPKIDGSRIVWEDKRSGNYDIYLYDLNAPELGEQQITTDSSYQLSPNVDGTRIVWDDSRSGDYDIYLYDLSAPELGEQQITSDSSRQLSPAINGFRIVWQDDRNGNNDIYLFD